MNIKTENSPDVGDGDGDAPGSDGPDVAWGVPTRGSDPRPPRSIQWRTAQDEHVDDAAGAFRAQHLSISVSIWDWRSFLNQKV